MKRTILNATLIAIACTILAAPAIAQGAYATIHGVCRDAQGQPVTDAQIVWHNQNDGRIYKLKTNKKGEYFSLGIEPGDYDITLTKDGKVLDSEKKFHVGLDEITHDIDLKQTQEENIKATAKKEGVSTEQVKQKQEEAAKNEQYNANIKVINQKMATVTDMLHAQPPDYDKAIAALNEINQSSPTLDPVWARLGIVYLDSAKVQTDPAEKTRRNTEAYNDLQKAIELKKSAMKTESQEQGPGKPPPQGVSDNTKLALYYDTLGGAAARLGKTDEAVNAYKQAAELDPPHAGSYYFNLGAVLTNTGTDQNAKKQAAEAFDKAIAADPTKADAYYWKGSNLIALSTADSAGKLSAPPGTAEAFQKYLELQPSGAHAEEAKQMLTVLNETIQTSYGTKKAPAKKK